MVGVFSNFVDFLRQKRVRQQITLRALARRIDIFAPFLSEIENGQCFSLDMLRQDKIATVLEPNEEERNIIYVLADKSRNTIAPDLP